ncbi:MAG TPA: hypothetical protein VJG32_03195 [Anaerolineae bacterium]|nr:hypothetical protein [Anaerolineae bacterium]
MNYGLFTVTQKKVDGEVFEPNAILRQRFSDKFWGPGERTPNRRYPSQGNRVVAYVGMPLTVGVATGSLET